MCPLAPSDTGTPFGVDPGRRVTGPTPSPRRPLLFQEVPLDALLAVLAARSSSSRSSVESPSLSPRPTGPWRTQLSRSLDKVELGVHVGHGAALGGCWTTHFRLNNQTRNVWLGPRG
jgi:hypothetical protein